MHRGIGSMVEVAPYWNAYLFCMSFLLLPPAKVMYLHLSVIMFTWGWGGITACLAGLQARTKEGRLRGLAWGVSRPTPRGVSPGPHPGGVSRPTLRGVSRPTRGGGVSQHALRQTPPPADRYCSGQYGSHWNAFLLHNI